MTTNHFNLNVQWWTSRGIGVVDVNYGGSTGYGRPFRRLLDGQWGIVDVEDCRAAAEYLVGRNLVDGARLAIRGGSAGGFTTLAALTTSDRFKAGASLYGVADLKLLASDTHKFKSRYLDRLIGPLPKAEALYAERSPIHHLGRLACPAIFFQGEDDKTVPPNQAETMVAAMNARSLPVAYYLFAGEGHGFRKAETLRRVLELELDFYGRVFGFTAPNLTERVEIANLGRPPKARPSSTLEPFLDALPRLRGRRRDAAAAEPESGAISASGASTKARLNSSLCGSTSSGESESLGAEEQDVDVDQPGAPADAARPSHFGFDRLDLGQQPGRIERRCSQRAGIGEILLVEIAPGRRAIDRGHLGHSDGPARRNMRQRARDIGRLVADIAAKTEADFDGFGCAGSSPVDGIENLETPPDVRLRREPGRSRRRSPQRRGWPRASRRGAARFSSRRSARRRQRRRAAICATGRRGSAGHNRLKAPRPLSACRFCRPDLAKPMPGSRMMRSAGIPAACASSSERSKKRRMSADDVASGIGRLAIMHDDDAGLRLRDNIGHRRIALQAPDVVDEGDALGRRETRDGRLRRIDRDRLCDALDDIGEKRRKARLFDVGRNWLMARPCRFGADVDNVGALRRRASAPAPRRRPRSGTCRRRKRNSGVALTIPMISEPAPMRLRKRSRFSGIDSARRRPASMLRRRSILCFPTAPPPHCSVTSKIVALPCRDSRSATWRRNASDGD